MAAQITVTLPDETYRHFQWLAETLERPLSELVSESLTHSLPSFTSDFYVPMESLRDEEVLAVANLMMDETQGQRMSELAHKQQEDQMNDAERTEFWALMHVYQVSLVRKAQGLREAVQRGLIPPLNS